MSWHNFNSQDDQGIEQEHVPVQPAAPVQPKKLIDSVSTLTTLSARTEELSSKILSDADQDTGLARQLTHLNISEVNKATSKETLYKTEEDLTDAFMNKVLNHDNDDLLKGVNYFSVSSERKKRYDIYEQMLDSNFLSFRILRAYINGVLIKNAQTKSFLTVQLVDEKAPLLTGLGKEVSNSYQKFVKSILMKFKLQQKMQEEIVPKTLLYGNYFIEIVDLNLLDNISQHEQILMESSMEPDPKIELKRKIEANRLAKVNPMSDHYLFESNFDCFKDETELTNHLKSILTEESLYRGAMTQQKSILESGGDIGEHAVKKYDIDALFEDSSYNLDSYDLNFLEAPEKDNDKKYTLEDISKLDMSKLKDIHLNYLSPRHVIVIEKDSYIYG